MNSASRVAFPDDKGNRRWLTAICSTLVAVVLVALPFRNLVVGFLPPFLGAYAFVLATCEAVTGLLLFWRARAVKSQRLALLSAAYAFTAPLIVANFLALPNVGYAGSIQAAPWTWVAWHAGWGLIVLGFALKSERPASHPVRLPLLGLTASLIVAALVLSSTALPRLISAADLRVNALMLILNGCTVVVLLAAFATLARRSRSLTTFEMWVLVAIAASALDTLVNAASGARFALGFYLGRALGMVAGAAVLVALFDDFMHVLQRANLLEVYEASERRLRTVLEEVPEIVWTADATGWIDWYNRRWYEYTGQTREEAAGWGWQAAHHPEDFLEVMKRWPDSIASGKPFEMEFRLRRGDGVFQWFLTRIVPERDATGRVTRWYGSNTNIESQKRELQRSARVAQIMQEGFLPTSFPQRPDLIFDALYLPAETDSLIGGDWYDAIALPGDRLLISCGDVAGHGLDAAILAGRYRQSITFSAVEDPDPGGTLQRVNHVALLQEEAFATAVVAVVDLAAGTLSYAIAGHPPPAVATAHGARMLEHGGLPLGVAQEARFETHVIEFGPDSVAVFYTDGITEFARDPLNAEPNVLLAAQTLRDRPVAEAAAVVKHLVMGGASPRDDVAIFVMQRVVSAVVGSEAVPISKTWRFHSSDPLTAHNARSALADFLALHAEDADGLHSSELIIGEALANTVEHAPGLVEVLIDWNGARPVLIVRDTGPGLEREPLVGLPAELDEDGRGLFLIHALAEDVTMENALGFGMELRCTLPLRRKSRPLSADGAAATASR